MNNYISSDFWEVQKHLAHAIPKGYQGMPSEIRTAGPKGMRQKAVDKEVKNNKILQRLKRSYQNLLGVADRYHTGKISYDQAVSLFVGHQQLIQNAYDKGGPGWDAAIGTVGGNDASAMKDLGFSDADIRKFTTFFDELSSIHDRLSQGSTAGMPSNILKRK